MRINLLIILSFIMVSSAFGQKNDSILIQKQINEKYDSLVADGEKSLKEMDFEKAKYDFEKALELKPKENYPQERLQKIAELCSSEDCTKLKIAKKYVDALKSGDKCYSLKDFTGALTYYEEALQTNVNAFQTKKKIINCYKSLLETESYAVEWQFYKKIIKRADIFFAAQDFDFALQLYQIASQNKPEEQYPKEQIKLCEILSLKMQQQEKDSVTKAPGNILEAKYNKAIETADEYFKNKDYANAKTFYENALKLKEDEKYPKDQIMLCAKLNADKLKKEADSLYNEASKKSDQTKQDSTKNKKFSFIGKWKGKIENDDVVLIFNIDGSFRGIVFDPKPDDVVGIWKLTGDSLYIEADEPDEISKPNYKNNPEKFYIKYKIISSDEISLIFRELKKESVFVRQK